MLARCCGCSPLKSFRFSWIGLAEAICEMRSQAARLRCPVWVISDRAARRQCRLMAAVPPTIHGMSLNWRYVPEATNLPKASDWTQTTKSAAKEIDRLLWQASGAERVAQGRGKGCLAIYTG
jgi:hypothetical protein